jgi:hypothetical protein
LENCSLLSVFSVDRIWLTSTVETKAVTGIVVGHRFVDSHGLLDRNSTGNDILVERDHWIQIVYFHLIHLEMSESENESTKETHNSGSSEERKPGRAIQAFASILFELVVGRRAKGETSIIMNVRYFFCEIIERWLYET